MAENDYAEGAGGDAATRSPLEEAQRALGFMGLRHELVMKLVRLAVEWLDEEVLLTRALEILADTIGAEASSVVMLDRHEEDLYFAAATGPVSRDLKQFRLERGEGIAGWCIESGQLLRVGDVRAEGHWHAEISKALGFDVRHILCAPIKVRNRTIGCVELVNKIGMPEAGFAPEDEELAADGVECVGILFALRGRRTSE